MCYKQIMSKKEILAFMGGFPSTFGKSVWRHFHLRDDLRIASEVAVAKKRNGSGSKRQRHE